MVNILAIDDEVEITNLIRRVLEKDGYRVDTENNPENIDLENLSFYNLILLDVMMPGIDGFTFCKTIRDKVDCPIIFLTAKTSEKDAIEGLVSGADDYIRKPFSIGELRARIAAHLRRQDRKPKNSLIIDDISFDISKKQVYFQDSEISLTKSEYLICEFLAKNQGQVFSLEQILENCLGFDSDSDTSAIREHVKNIRNKFSKFDIKPIETVWGIGYKWS